MPGAKDGAASEGSTVRSVGHKAWRSAYWVWEIATHPANKGGRLAAERRAMTWHWRARSGEVEAIVTIDRKTKLRARPHQFSAVWTIYDGVHEWEELQFCLGYLRPGEHFVDVGANVGVFSTLIGTRIPGVRITAVEPFPPVRADLEANLALNHLDITVVGSAVSDAEGEATFEVLDRDVLNRLALSGSEGGGRGITVAVTTLDQLVGDDPPALVKIDVEGAELSVMRGAERLLSEASPVLLFEHAGHSEHFGVSAADMRAFLTARGYTIHLLDGGLTPWHSDLQPPTPNVIATRNISAVRARLADGGGAPASPPVRVDVEYVSG
jgi:FkbM family methyltransferase